MTRVLGVHGIGNYKYIKNNGGSPDLAAAAMSAEWAGWLGIPTADVRVAYYAQHLHRGTPQGADDPSTMEAGEQELLVAWVDQLVGPGQIAQGPRTARARAAAAWVARNFGSTAKSFAMTFTREVHTYLSERDTVRRTKARLAVANALAQHRPDAVIAHSLGSVVAYEALWAYPHQPVDLLITVGSPLAMPGVVLHRLQPDAFNRRGGRPPGVRRWVNLADIGDIVAIPRGGIADSFDGVDNDAEVVIGGWDFHAVRNYLRCPDLQRHLP
jgi:hypothetical protein